MEDHFAFCDGAGVINIATFDAIPDGVIIFAKGQSSDLEKKISGSARLTYDGKTFLVPGVPEASDAIEALGALERWRTRNFPGQELTLHITAETAGA